MHWAVLVLPPVLTIAVLCSVAVFQHLKQQQEREQQYWAPFRRCCQDADSSDVEPRLIEQLLATVEARLRFLRDMPPGPARSRRVRALRAEHHPDRFSGRDQELVPFVAEVSAVVNTRTEVLLEEDRAAAQQRR